MRSNLILIAACLGFAACTEQASNARLNVENLQRSDCLADDTADTAASGDLIADPAGAGTIRVDDVANLSCCIDDIRVKPSVDGATITVDYEEKGTPCDCGCTYAVSYEVSGLDSGTYTVIAQQDETTVTVE
jgi:hypothetical protein